MRRFRALYSPPPKAKVVKKTIGFIMLRHVNDALTNQYWIHCYTCIRKFYTENEIIIIDDNSNTTFISPIPLYKTTIIQSEYPQRGELLPYYYFLRNKLFDIAVIIHDSVFIQKYMDFNVNTYKLMWDFKHDWDKIEEETPIISAFRDDKLTAFHKNKHLWKGCFGGMSIVSYDYLASVNAVYNFDILLPLIKTRPDRCTFERIIAVLLQINSQQPSFLGNIHAYCNSAGIHWGGITFKDKDRPNYKHLPLLKVWTGR
jgi:hypothetical protein